MEIYDLAHKLGESRIWEKLNRERLFAVRRADGALSYVCAMSADGRRALAAYFDGSGLDSLRDITDAKCEEPGELQRLEAAFSQDCAMLMFVSEDELPPRDLKEARAYRKARRIAAKEGEFPLFKRFSPCRAPWFLRDADDVARVREALEAALEVAARLEKEPLAALGFTDGEFYEREIPLLRRAGDGFAWSKLPLPPREKRDCPSPKLRDELRLTKATRGKKRGEWALDVFMNPSPYADEVDAEGEPTSAPIYPYVLLIVDNKTGMAIQMRMAEGPDEYAEALVDAVVDTVIERGRPARILTPNERARTLFVNLASQLEVELALEEDIPLLAEAEEAYARDVDADDGESMEHLLEMLSDREALASLPDEIIEQLSAAARGADLPSEIAEIIEDELKRRGLN